MSIRITGLQEVATLQSGDFVAVDNTTTGTHKFDATKLGAGIEANLAPTYSSAATYNIGNFCIYDGVMYKCTTAITSPENWTASHWTQTSAGVALADKVDKVSGKGLSQNDFTNALKTKLDGIEAGAEANVQADWAQTNTSADDYIKNKPTDATTTTAGLMSASDKVKLNGIQAGAEVNVQADWNETDSSADDYIKNKPSTATASTNGLMSSADKAKLDGIASGAEVNVQADWAQTNTSADDYIKNKPTAATASTTGLMSAADKAKLDSIAQGAEVNVQADWAQTDISADDYIKNKPVDATESVGGLMSAEDKAKLNGIEDGAQVNVIDGVKVDGTLLTVDGNKDVDIVGKANQTSLAPQYSSDTGNYVRGNYVIYQNNLYKCLQATTGTWDATKWEQVDIGDELEEKANIDGLYEGMTVGGAEQLLSNVYEEDQVPYNFRTSGGSIDIGDREYDEIVGGSLVWNQLVANADFSNGLTDWNYSGATVTTDSGIATCTMNQTTFGSSYLTSTRQDSIIGHKYYVNVQVKTDENATSLSNVYWGVRDHLKLSNISTTFSKLESITSATSVNDVFIISNGLSGAVGDKFYVKSPQVFDLTAMFGSTIADYIYSLEQANEGAGVAWFRKLFPKPYYEYNAGELMSVKAASHEMVGFNQFDPKNILLGSYSGNTWTIPTTALPSTKQKVANVAFISGTRYYFSGKSTQLVENKNFRLQILYTDGTTTNLWASNTTTEVSFGVLSDANKDVDSVVVNYGSGGGGVIVTDFCINLHWDGERDGEYEPYKTWSYPLDDTLELRGIPKLDASNQLYYDGDTYESDGTVTRRYGIVDLGTLGWNKSDSTDSTGLYYFYSPSIKNQIPHTYNEIIGICSKYIWHGWTGRGDKNIVIDSSGNLYIYDSTYQSNTAAEFKASLSGVYLAYELATPTTEQADPFQNPQIVDDWGTERYVDADYEAEERDVEIPVGHDTKYLPNLRAKLEDAPNNPSSNGDYIMRRTSEGNSYVPLVILDELPTIPTTDGTYNLQVTIASGEPTLTWVSTT